MKIETRCEEWEKDEILAILFGNRRDGPVALMTQIPLLMNYIHHDAVAQYGYRTEMDDSLRRTYV